MSNLDHVKQQLASNADVSAEYIMKILGVTKPYAYNLLSKGRKELRMIKQRDGKWTHKIPMQRATREEKIVNPAIYETVAVMTTNESIADKLTPPADNVNHPAHYKVGGIETIDFIEAKSLNYHLGNVVKYVTRADHKGDRLENLEKARWYLDREIGNLSEKLANLK
jgi:hypothetical protein